jgi:plasmid stabilization system protein ParE
MKIKFSHTAYNCLDAMSDYIYERSASKTVTVRYLKQFRRYIVETLKLFPKAGRPSDELEPNSRKLVYHGYSIIYRISGDRIEILTLYRENLP